MWQFTIIKLLPRAKTIEALQKALQRHPELKPEQIEIDYIQIADELIL